MSLPFRHSSPINTSLKIYIIRTIAPEQNCPPTPKLTLTQTLNLNGGNFLRGQLSGCPPTLKVTLTLTQTPTLTGGAIVRTPFLVPVVVWICRMGEIICFQARFFIHPKQTKEFENAYKEGCLIAKISSKIKTPSFRSFLLKKGVSKLQKKRMLTNT